MENEQTSSSKKGRPTPKRKDAQAARITTSLAPATTKAEKAKEKEATRVARVASRIAYLRGDENALPARDRGPARRFVRNYVDARRSVGEFFLPVIFIVLILSIIPQPIFQLGGIFVMYTVLLVSVVDGVLLGRKLRKEVSERFPEAPTKGLAMYGWLRSTQMRRMRAPKPQIKAGDTF